ncbi:LTA synthase family protein [Stutzerimonas balearica]|uniref:LTA synthase family protein n=1 Tax=Stutzerimonas balearica TaxID=74829 RepID=UPI00190D1294|nr:LTA synthase family protein [Stutzerimonas balearica]MBK3747049.1 sulfatase-like hydrolase/transferase [Stutzerimonas balearica]MBK3825246.1 sulfatase-like hydrolase/transferase [Stutzerimonas balearica]MBK3854937.1 sulfatase-like hydrolase/transferase [Stutzerimonas balearica]
MPFPRHAQLRYLALLLGLWLGTFVLTRSALLVAHWQEATAGSLDILRIYAEGAIYDLAYLAFAAVPLALYLALCPRKIWASRWHRFGLRLLLVLSLYAMLFTAVAEWLFWDEFGVRFNFIAVDYLVYSDEVIHNIMESYPLFTLLGLLAALALALGLALQRPLSRALAAPSLPWRGSLATLAGVAGLALAAALVVGQDFPRGSGGNAYQRELASNGPFQFFAAFRNNELDYPQFYATLPDAEIGSRLRREVAEPNARFLGKDPLDIRRAIDNPGQPRHLNVVLVTIESLSAKYLGSFGDARGLTPNLDELRKHSLTFTNFYATGTRTDRGLEAITLSVPPTPGRSIVKRIGRESGFASLGQQLGAQGYDSVFLYGGRGYFDNMSAFFGGNGYRVVDQSSADEADIHFKNAWGMADEDLYALAMREADADHAAGKPFLLQLMTTSNHRPYTYPDGRIDIPSGDGREGAVKYTDYAIGQFLDKARRKPWFKDTLFVFVADHTAGSAGSQDLPVANYHIPLFVYAPGLIEPREFAGLASQIDLAPTLLGLLNMDYVSTFFGRNLLREDAAPGRALIGNYQHLGLFDGRDLAILSPRLQVRRHDEALRSSRESEAPLSDPLVQRDIAYYQGASHDYRQGLLSWRAPAPHADQLSQR